LEELDRASEVAHASKEDVTRLAKGAGIMVPGRIVGRGLALLAQVILARGLGQEAFGLFAIAWTFLRTGEFVGALGLEQGVVRFGSDYRRTNPPMHKKVMVLGLGSASVVSLLFGALVLLAAPWLAESFFGKPELTPLLRIVAFGLLFAAGLNVAAAATRVSLRMQYAFFAQEIIQPGTNLVLVLAFLYAGYALRGVTAAVVLSYVAGCAVALFCVVRLFPQAWKSSWPREPILRSLLGFSAATWVARVFTSGLINSDRILVGRFLGSADVGLYQAASQIATLFPIIIAAFSAILTPLFSDLHHRNATGRLALTYRLGAKWGLYACLPLYLVVTLGARDLVQLVYGSPYSPASVPLIILAIAQIFFVLSNAPGLLLMMVGQQKAWLSVCGVSFVCGVVTQVLLIPRWGLAGAGVGMVAGMATLAVGGIGAVRATMRLWPFDRQYVKGLVAAVLAALSIVGVGLAGIQSAFLILALATIGSCTVFVLVLLLLGLETEEKHLVGSLKARLTRGPRAGGAS
jgi:stage V sporulation protein B